MFGRSIFIVLAVSAASPATAEGWARYENARYGYVLELPPGFSTIVEADNSDGGRSTSPQGSAELRVWGTNLLDRTFAQEADWRIAQDRKEGWTISYRHVKPMEAAWSGTRSTRIVYVRAVPICRDQASYLQIEYDASAKAAFDPLVRRLAQSLKGIGDCR